MRWYTPTLARASPLVPNYACSFTHTGVVRYVPDARIRRRGTYPNAFTLAAPSPKALQQMRLLPHCLLVGITLLAAAPAVHAQDTLLIPCNGAPVGGTYCYTDNDEHAWHWQSECGAPMMLEFISGTIESSPNDHLRFYDGPDDLSPLMFSNGTNPAVQDLTGLSFMASSGDLYVQMTSNATNSCATDGFRDASWEWTWTVSSGSVEIPEEQAATFTMYPNPATSELHLELPSPAQGAVEIRILDVTGRIMYQQRFAASGPALNTFDLRGLQSGHYSVVLTTAGGLMSQQLQVMR